MTTIYDEATTYVTEFEPLRNPGHDLCDIGAEVVHFADRTQEVYHLERNPDSYEVIVRSDVTLADYKEHTTDEDWELLSGYAEQLTGKKIVFINPTMEGGGVAMLRPPLVHMLKQFGVDAHWYVMEAPKDGEPNVFDVTKKIHNISQRRLGDERLSDEEKAIHWNWCAQNAEILGSQDNITSADVIFIDDPQPAPLKVLLKDSVKDDVKWIWRNHIDTSNELMSDSTTPQGEIADYLLSDCELSSADAFVMHPVPAFEHPGMGDKTYMAPATTDPFDDLNRVLSTDEIAEGLEFINNQIRLKNESLAVVDTQSEIDPNRKRMILVARFDESKGMDKAMALGVRVRDIMRSSGVAESILPQVVLVGNGSVDDPSGVPMYESMLQLRRELFPEDKKDIIIMRLIHNYMAMNALMYPTGSDDGTDEAQLVALQTSEAEGCETRISDWIEHGAPVVIFNNGGMPLQVKEGESGHIMDYNQPDHSMEDGAQFISQLMLNPETYGRMRKSTEETAKIFNRREFTTTANVTRLARVISYVLSGRTADRTWKIAEMIAE